MDAKDSVDGFFNSFGVAGGEIQRIVGWMANPLKYVQDQARLAAASFSGNDTALREALGYAAEATDNAAASLSGFGAQAGYAAAPTEDLTAELEAEAAAAEKAAQEFDKLSAAISKTNAVTSYQSAIDDLRKTLKETKNETSVFNDKGRDTVGAYTSLADSAGKYIETLDSQAQQASVARGTLDELKKQLGNTKMDPATAAALLNPFQALIDDLEESGINVDDLQIKLDKIKSKTITITVDTKTTGGRPPGVSSSEWYGTATGGAVPKHYATGGSAKGMDTVPAMLTPGEFVIRRQMVRKFGAGFFSQLNRGINPLAGMTPSTGGSGGGFSIGTINVTSAPGEKAEESVPRTLRRMAFLAGV
jgi:archaellum component FlaC